MRENCTSGSVQGAPGNRRSYCARLLGPAKIDWSGETMECQNTMQLHKPGESSAGSARFFRESGLCLRSTDSRVSPSHGARIGFDEPRSLVPCGSVAALRPALPLRAGWDIGARQSNKGAAVRRLTASSLRCRSGRSPSSAAERQR